MSRHGRLLLRMYPAEFRDDYGEEALRLIQERWRDERGTMRRLRLCLDLAIDLVMTHLRPRTDPSPTASAAAQGGVLFGAFARNTIGATTVLPGMVISLLMVAMFVRLITPEGDRDIGILLHRAVAFLGF